ncbi:MAG: ribosome biogenesis GTP-binding protein YihA/YsxC [Halothiobacillaceae bacterium]
MNWFQNIRFDRSAHKLIDLPPDEGREVAFAGRSNAGKSSAINAIVGRRGLARASKTPGRTQQINFFVIDESRRLVDLPGYGYAKVPKSMQQHWQQTLGEYFETRLCLAGLCVIMDIRHPLKPQDWQMLHWAHARDLPVLCLLTKADKLSRNAIARTVMDVRGALTREGVNATVQAFSALQPAGIPEARATLGAWFSEDPEPEPAG